MSAGLNLASFSLMPSLLTAVSKKLLNVSAVFVPFEKCLPFSTNDVLIFFFY